LGRIARATRQLELAAQLEARLEALLGSPALGGLRPPVSAEREEAELAATEVILQAELRAAAILNATSGPGLDDGRHRPVPISPGPARALGEQLAALAKVEEDLVELARQALQLGGGAPPSGGGAGGATAPGKGRLIPMPTLARPGPVQEPS
jgi:hypothetical protein